MESSSCECNVAQISWDTEAVQFDEHQAVVPGTCSCGSEYEYVYNEAGIRERNGGYIKEF